MVKRAPSATERARGALLGLAAGPAPDPGLSPDTPASRPPADAALALILAEELLAPEIPLERVVHRWIDWVRRGGEGLDEESIAALDHLAAYDAPPDGPGAVGPGPLARCVPIALATAASPRNLVSGTFHTAALTHPDPRSAWSAVAVNVALARFVQGRRDFVADVLEALRNNQAPDELVQAVRRVPLARRDDLPVERAAGDAVACAEVALWLAYHEPLVGRGLGWLADRGAGTTAGAVVGALLGARDGVEAIPPERLRGVADAERIGALAERLLGAWLASAS
ncbi:MAG TPA: ADP-ribosylglycohydrolase family protein [Gemmatimonadales bacterium]|nr:ADP-ribosylglycohydrolase family protein [Gemmatimonadales bacterium]